MYESQIKYFCKKKHTNQDSIDVCMNNEYKKGKDYKNHDIEKHIVPGDLGTPCKENYDCSESSFCCSESKCVLGKYCELGLKPINDNCNFKYEC